MKCDKCGYELRVGDWPYCHGDRNDHGKPTAHKGFLAYDDIQLGQRVTGWGDINKACKPKWNQDHIEQIQPRDLPASYYRELKERREARVRDKP